MVQNSSKSCLHWYIYFVDKLWLAKILIGILIINTLAMLTIAHADRGRPTLKDADERFQNGLGLDSGLLHMYPFSFENATFFIRF